VVFGVNKELLNKKLLPGRSQKSCAFKDLLFLFSKKISFLLLFIEMRMEEHTQQFFPYMIA
jgi:hypothetical protein